MEIFYFDSNFAELPGGPISNKSSFLVGRLLGTAPFHDP